ncbi:folate transporter 1, chloroplastic-like [Hibiscus syriacus]|uniref:folate transporter 1, chloroplastic-like n=1 Tax=Hibiscus syriacus TaxID=106335 RepID=UPI00192240BE|nr:folate transporter 1, chloroplastic-like [Hibiscus syriacus]
MRSAVEWQRETAAAGAVAGFATVAAMYPLDIVRTRFQGHSGLKGLYAGFLPAVLGSTVSWGLYFFVWLLYLYGRAKQRYSKNREEKLSSGLHLASAAEAGPLVSLCTNPIWLIKTRLQLQNPLNQN